MTGPALRERVDAALAAVDMLAHRDRSADRALLARHRLELPFGFTLS